MSPRAPSRITVHRGPRRGRYDWESIRRVLDRGTVAHVSLVDDEQPYTLPMLYARCEERVLIHGSSASRLTRLLGAGCPACVTVTVLDGLVLARSVFEHTANYESVMLLGRFVAIDAAPEKLAALRALTEALLPGRWDEVRAPSATELRATRVLALAISEASVKARSGPPSDSAADAPHPVWAGVVPIDRHYGVPQTAPDLPADAALAPSVARLLAREPG